MKFGVSLTQSHEGHEERTKKNVSHDDTMER